MPYTPPPQVHINTEVNVFRPDGRDRIQTTAEHLGNDFSVGLSRTDYANPRTAVNQIYLDFALTPTTEATIGAALSEGSIIPEFTISQVVLNESDRTLRLYFARSLNSDDPRAVRSLIQRNTVGGNLRLGSVQNNFSVDFNSDGVEVYKNFLSIPLTDDGFLTLNSYMRAASEESDYYWDESFYAAAGVLVAVPVVQRDGLSVALGVQPGLVYSADDDELRLGATAGARVQYEPSDNFALTGTISYSYGLNAALKMNFSF